MVPGPTGLELLPTDGEATLMEETGVGRRRDIKGIPTARASGQLVLAPISEVDSGELSPRRHELVIAS